jgi:hypothetical protein
MAGLPNNETISITSVCCNNSALFLRWDRPASNHYNPTQAGGEEPGGGLQRVLRLSVCLSCLFSRPESVILQQWSTCYERKYISKVCGCSSLRRGTQFARLRTHLPLARTNRAKATRTNSRFVDFLCCQSVWSLRCQSSAGTWWTGCYSGHRRGVSTCARE